MNGERLTRYDRGPMKNKTGKPRAWLIALACVLPFAQPAAADEAGIAAAVDHAFKPLLARYDVPGIAVAVTVDGHRSFFNYGVASKASGAPVTQDTLFEIGSVSKTFTATLAGYALGTGRFSLQDHPGKFMPQLHGSAVDKATLLDLGTFTAGGLPLQVPDAVTDDAAMLRFFRQWQPDAAPGEQRRYSNPSIGLFGHIAALSMGGSFAPLVERKLFPMLRLERSYIRVPASQMGRYAWGYNKAGQPIHVNPGVFDAEAYGVKSTSADMLRFVEANLRPDKLKAPLRQAILATHVGYYRVGPMAQGLAWEQYPFPVPLPELLDGNSERISMHANAVQPLGPPRAAGAATLFNKTGSTNGFGAYVAFVPQRKIGIVMLANRNFPIEARVTAAYAVLQQLAAEAP